VGIAQGNGELEHPGADAHQGGAQGGDGEATNIGFHGNLSCLRQNVRRFAQILDETKYTGKLTVKKVSVFEKFMGPDEKYR
jgi:hypothetical protein